MATFNRMDICMAYYLFGSLYHGGQSSKEYTYMGRAMKVGFKPGINGIVFESLSENAKDIFLPLLVSFENENALGCHGIMPEDYEE